MKRKKTLDRAATPTTCDWKSWPAMQLRSDRIPHDDQRALLEHNLVDWLADPGWTFVSDLPWLCARLGLEVPKEAREVFKEREGLIVAEYQRFTDDPDAMEEFRGLFENYGLEAPALDDKETDSP